MLHTDDVRHLGGAVLANRRQTIAASVREGTIFTQYRQFSPVSRSHADSKTMLAL